MLHKKALSLGVAESCTGGLISHRITNVAGSSDYFEGAVISYSNELKKGLLDVKDETLRKFGAVSQECAKEMTVGVRELAKTDIGLAVTGIAGPGGGIPEKPVGLVYIALASSRGVTCKEYRVQGNREENKNAFANAALGMLLEHLKE